MEVYPYIYESVFGETGNSVYTASDSVLNADMLRAMTHMMPATFENGAWTAAERSVRRIRIEDAHDGEEDPHYVLDVGSKAEHALLPAIDEYTLVVKYCDNAMRQLNVMRRPEIVQQTGRFRIYVDCGACKHSPHDIARTVARFYLEALRKNFRDLYTCTNMPELEPEEL